MNINSETARGAFWGFAIGSLLAGFCFLGLCILLWNFSWHETAILLFGVSMMFAGLANCLAFLVFHRMESLGYAIGLFRWPSEDMRIYKAYWRTAKDRGWSRLPVVGFIAFFALAALFFVLTAKFSPN